MDAAPDEPSSEGHPVDEPVEPTPSHQGRRAGEILRDLWYQKPGPRTAASKSGATTKEIVNGLDRRETMLGYAASGLALIGTVINFFVDRHSPVASARQYAGTLLVAGLIVSLLMLAGTVLRRRALLGFSSFLTGMEVITAGNITGILFLGFGGWLILRVMRKQKLDREAGKDTRTVDVKPDPRRPAGRPKASKRYTPPGRAGARKR